MYPSLGTVWLRGRSGSWPPCDLYETVTITQTVSQFNTRSKVDWITEGMHKMDFTVSNMPGNMNQKGVGVTKRKYDLSQT